MNASRKGRVAGIIPVNNGTKVFANAKTGYISLEQIIPMREGQRGEGPVIGFIGRQ